MKYKAAVIVLLRTVLPLAVGMVLLVAVIAWLAGVFIDKIQPGPAEAAHRETAPKDPKLRSTVHEVEKPYFAEAVGSLKAAARTEISARVMGEIQKVLVIAGQSVARGDPLIELDRRTLETRRSRSRAGLAAAKAAADQAENDYRRVLNLIKKDATSRRQLDNATGRRDVTVAELEAARQALAEAEVLYSYTTIRAPKTGKIIDPLVEPGDMAQPGVPLLEIYDPTTLRLEVPVMENLAVKLKRGQILTARIDAFNLDVKAEVDEIVPQAEAASRSFLVKAKVPRSQDLFEGMYGRLRIPAGVRRHLCLATEAIQRIGQLEFVNVIRPNGTLERRYIKTGRLGMPGRIEVLSGLSAGEQVLLRRSGAEADAGGDAR